MFQKIKTLIITLAKNAVYSVEAELGSGSGSLKKQKAISYVIEHLPLPPFIKQIAAVFLSEFIDASIEIAVEYMNSLPKLQGE